MEKNFYIGKLYLKNFLFVWIGLILFFLTIDYIQVGKSISGSNAKILYLYYKSLNASSILFPISLVFASIITFAKLIKENTLVAFYSLGYSDRDLISVPFLISTFLVLIYIFLHFTPYALAEERAEAIKIGADYYKGSEALFFKHDVVSKSGKVKSYYIYFSTLYPFKSSAKDVRLFSVLDERILEVIMAEDAYYRNNRWVLKPAKFLYNTDNPVLNGQAIQIREYPQATLLKGFKPKILNKIYENNSNFRLYEMFEAMRLLNLKGYSIDKLKASFYSIVAFPFVAPILILLIFILTPISSRFQSLNLFIFLAILSTLLIWGFLYTLSMMAKTGNLYGELVIILPILILSAITIYLKRKK
ncbi:putative permease [Thiovulum sp. ES]|nr:putative permease [Thiovulum sp. ES]